MIFLVTVFLEFLQPAISLVIIGAGNDAIPVMQIADALGWEIILLMGGIRTQSRNVL